jgi:hypothetical protein
VVAVQQGVKGLGLEALPRRELPAALRREVAAALGLLAENARQRGGPMLIPVRFRFLGADGLEEILDTIAGEPALGEADGW